MLKSADIRSAWARAAFLGLSLMWSLGGWLIVIDGGFTKSFRHSKHTVRVDGSAGLVMAYLFFLLSSIALAVLLQSLGLRRVATLAVAAAVVVTPTVYLLSH